MSNEDNQSSKGNWQPNTRSTPAFRSIDSIRPLGPERPRPAFTPPAAAESPTNSAVVNSRPEAKKPMSDSNTNVTININLPKIPKPRLPKLPWRRIITWAIIGIILVVISIVLRYGIGYIVEQRRIEKIRNEPAVIEKTTPSFAPVVPKTNPGVVQTAAYDGKRDTYSYSDKLKGTELVVSQQPLPSGASGKVLLDKVAKSIDATTPLLLSSGTAFMASNQSTGSQTIVMSTATTLVFVQSPFKHSSEEWISYLNNLTV